MAASEVEGRANGRKNEQVRSAMAAGRANDDACRVEPDHSDACYADHECEWEEVVKVHALAEQAANSR